MGKLKDMLAKYLPKRTALPVRIAASELDRPTFGGSVPMALSPLAPTVTEAMLRAAERGGHVGMKGQKPSVSVSVNRVRCDSCKKELSPGVRHICIYNAHHHLASLTDAERASLIADLQALGVKDSPAKKSPARKHTRRSEH